jgi:beta-fructofuranosidase
MRSRDRRCRFPPPDGSTDRNAHANTYAGVFVLGLVCRFAGGACGLVLGDRTTADDIEVGAGQQIVLDSIAGNAIEISMTIDPGDAHEVGLNVLRSPDAEETTRISFFPKGHQRWGSAHLQIDGSSSSIRTDLIPRPPELAPFDLSKSESINLRIFVDRSIIEVFANDMQCLTLRAYPDRDDSVGVSLFSRGGTAKFTGIESWKMECTWPELR